MSLRVQSETVSSSPPPLGGRRETETWTGILDGAQGLSHMQVRTIMIAMGSFTDKAGNTALHYAVNVDAEEIVEALLVAGAKGDVENRDGETPLSMADGKGR